MTTTTPQARYLDQMYGSTPEYRDRLVPLVHNLGYQLARHESRWPCCLRLTHPRHHCNRCHDATRRPEWWDHTHWLRRGTGRHPLRWAILTQPYYPPGTFATMVADWTQASGITVVWQHLGGAPYGHGADAYLVEGTA